MPSTPERTTPLLPSVIGLGLAVVLAVVALMWVVGTITALAFKLVVIAIGLLLVWWAVRQLRATRSPLAAIALCLHGLAGACIVIDRLPLAFLAIVLGLGVQRGSGRIAARREARRLRREGEDEFAALRP